MTKREYLEILEKNLQGIGQEETGDILDYVAEYFDEAGKRKPWRRWDHRRAVPVR